MIETIQKPDTKPTPIKPQVWGCVYWIDGKSGGGFELTNCPKPELRAELIAKTINTIPRILEILRRG